MSVVIDEVEASISQNQRETSAVENTEDNSAPQNEQNDKKCDCIYQIKKRAARLSAD